MSQLNSTTDTQPPASTVQPRRRRDMSVRAKLLVLVIITTLGIIGVQTWLAIDSDRQQNQLNEQRRLQTLYDDYRAKVSDNALTSAVLSTAFADRPDMRALFAARDRAGLLKLLTPVFTTLKTQYNLVHLYLEEPAGTVFVRIHKPEQYGDNVTYRRTVAEALAKQQTVAGIEIGPSRLGVRGVSPLFDNEQFIGLVEVGLDYDQAFIDALKQRTGGDYRLWVTTDAAAPAGLQPAADAPTPPLPDLFFYAGTSPAAPLAPAEVYQRVLATGRPENLIGLDGDQNWAVLIAPLQAYPERTIGAIEILTSRTADLAALRQNQITLFAIAAGLALLGFALLSALINAAVLRPLRHLSSVASRQLNGDLTARAQLETRDEFSQLGNTLNSFTAQLRHSIDSLENRTAQLRASAEVGHAAASILDTKELLRTIVNLIVERFSLYYAAVFTLDATGKKAVLREATGEAGRSLKERGHQLEVGGHSMVGYATAHRKARIAFDVGAETVRFDNPLLPLTRSEIALPLIAGDRVLGALDVQSTQAAAFDEASAAVLQSMADQIAVALSNAEQFKQTEEALKNTRNLFAASQEMSTALDADGLLHTLIRHITPDAGRAAIALFGPRDETGHPAYYEFTATWVQAEYAATLHVPPLLPGARLTPHQLPAVGIFNAVTPARPLIVPDANADEVTPALRALLDSLGADALIALALNAGQNPLGILIVGYRQSRVFSNDYLQALVTLSNQAAIVIQNQRSLAEAQVTLKQLDLVNRRLTGEAWRAYTAPLGGALTIRDVAPDAQGEATPAALDAPIVVRGEPIGALKLKDVDPDRTWSANDRTLLEAVANEIAVAIDNARLLEQTEHRAQREQLISEISRKMLAASDMQSIIQIAGDELGQALRVTRTAVRIGAE